MNSSQKCVPFLVMDVVKSSPVKINEADSQTMLKAETPYDTSFATARATTLSSSSNTSSNQESTPPPNAPRKTKKKNTSLMARLSFLNLTSFQDSSSSNSDRVTQFKRINRTSSKESVKNQDHENASCSSSISSRHRSFSENTNLMEGVKPFYKSKSEFSIMEEGRVKALEILESRIGSKSSALIVYNVSQAACALAEAGDRELEALSLNQKTPLAILKKKLRQPRGNLFRSFFRNQTKTKDKGKDEEDEEEEAIIIEHDEITIDGQKKNSTNSTLSNLSMSTTTTVNCDSSLSMKMYNSNHSNHSSKNSVVDLYQELHSDLTKRFSGVKPPKIQLDRYLGRIVRYLDRFQEHEPSENSGGIRALLMGAIYIDRLRALNPEFKITSYNIHRLMMTAMLIALKVSEDDHPTNEYYASVGGLEVAELYELELSFCIGCNFYFHVSLEDLQLFYDNFQDNDTTTTITEPDSPSHTTIGGATY